jgi:SpoVK/Ycf46/Vps4 family AAA+-type ATPase
MDPLNITLDDIEYALRQMEVPGSYAGFGNREWEMALSAQCDDIWSSLLTHASEQDGLKMLEVLTLIYGVVYSATGGVFPTITKSDEGAIRSEFRGQDRYNRIAENLEKLLSAHNQIWSTLVVQEILTAPLSAKLIFDVYVYGVLLMRKLSSDQADGKPPAEENSPGLPSQKSASETEQDQIDKIMPVHDTGVTFDDLGGFADVRRQFEELADMINHPEALARWAVPVPRGVLLYGPPGVGKTMWARALASAVSKPFFEIKQTQVSSSFINASSRMLDRVFTKARKAGGAVIFFDEVDALAISRNNHNSHVEELKVLAALNQNLQRPSKPDGLTILMATNRRDLLDAASIRAERIDWHISIGLPDVKDRLSVLQAHIMKAQEISGNQLFSALDEAIAQRMEGFSCADIAEVVKQALRLRGLDDIRGLAPTLITGDELLTIATEYASKHQIGGNRKRNIGFLP